MRINLDDIWSDSIAHCIQGESAAPIRTDKWMYLTHAIGQIVKAGGKELDIRDLAEAVRLRLEPLGNRTKVSQIRKHISDKLRYVDKRRAYLRQEKNKRDWSPNPKPQTLQLIADPTEGISQEKFEAVAKAMYRRDEALRQARDLLGEELAHCSQKLLKSLGLLIEAGTPLAVHNNNHSLLNRLCDAHSGFEIVAAEDAGIRQRNAANYMVRGSAVEAIPDLNVPHPFWLDSKIREIRRPFLNN